MTPYLLVVGIIIVIIYILITSKRKEGFANIVETQTAFVNHQNTYFQEQAGNEILTNPGLNLSSLNAAMGQPDLALPVSLDRDYTVFFTENPVPEFNERDMKFCNGAKMPIDLPKRTDDDIVACGWYYKPDSAKPSVGVLGTIDGPIIKRADIAGGQWIWDINTAQMKEEIKICKRIRDCALLDIDGIQGKCGFCKEKGHAIPITTNGMVKYPNAEDGNCGTNVIQHASDCNAKTELVTEEGVKCGNYGRPSPDNSIRLYNQDECNKLGGNAHGNGVCTKPGGGSFSYDCRGLNNTSAPFAEDGTTENSENIQPPSLCSPDAQGNLSHNCLISIAKAMGMSETGAIIGMLKMRRAPNEVDNMAIKTIKTVGIDIPNAALTAGKISVESAGKIYGRIYALMRDGPSIVVKDAATWLSIGGIEFDICKLEDTTKGPFSIECMQRAFKMAGCQPGGTRYPVDGDHKLSPTDYANMTWAQLNQAYKNLYEFMKSENVGTQNSAMQQCLGKGSEFYRKDVTNRCWKCVPGILTPVSKNDNGDIECASTDGRNCLWVGTPAKCEEMIQNMPKNLKPLSCGPPHQSLYGITGYNYPAHWCTKAKESDEFKMPTGDYEYKGCFKDKYDPKNPSLRAIPTYKGKVSTVDQCKAIALANGGNTFGVQYGGECWIGHNSPYDKYGKATTCGTLGGPESQHVYKVEEKYEFKGCYKDDPRRADTRAIPHKVAQVKSIEECRKHASNYGVNTFGVQFGGECWIGNDADYAKYGKATNCGVLGGSASNLVYQTQTKYEDKGCFRDDSTRAIPYLIADKNVTVNRCKELAMERDADTFGLQANYQCFIGDDVKYDKFGKVGSCGAMGGNWVNRVYKKAPRFEHKGCFKDTPERAIPIFAKRTRNFDECKQEALNRGMNTFGIQAGNECWVGNDSPYDKYGPATSCGPYAGGGWANKVYKAVNK